MATYPAFESRPALHPAGASPAMDAPNPNDRIALAEQLLDAAERAQSFTNASGAVIALRRGDELIVRTSSGLAPEVGASFALDDGVIGLCVRTEKPQECSTEKGDAGANPLLAALSIRSVAAVPVRYQGSVRAVLAVFSPSANAFHRTHVAILMTLRDLIANNLQQAPLPLSTAQLEVVAKVSERFAAPRVAPVPNPVPAAPVAPPVQVEPPKPVSVSPVSPPPPTTTMAELLKLVESPAPAPVKPVPELLSPGEDPGAYKRQPPVTASLRPVGLAPAVQVATLPRPSLLTEPAAARNRSSARIKAVVALAALVVVAAALGLYWGSRQRPTAVATPTLHATPIPTPAQPVETVTVTAQVAPPVKPAAVPTPSTAPREKPAATQPAEAPALALTPAAHKPAPQAPAEAPALSFAANTAMPALPSPMSSAPTLAARHADLIPAVLTQQKAPTYPDVARRLGIQGIVKLQISIAADGSVSAVRVLSGETMLREASVNAVRQWRYRPAMLDGHPVESTADVLLSFKKP